MKVGFFSTDWAFDPVPDRLATVKSGRQEFVPHKRSASYGGTFYYRMALPAMELAKHGHECVLSWAVDTAPDGHQRVYGTDGVWHDDCDVVVFQRWMGNDGAERARKARATGQLIVQDVDDHFWALPKSNVASVTTSSNASFNRFHYWDMIEASSAVFCSTATLAARLERTGRPTFVCRNAIDIDRWSVHDPDVDGVVGWVGGIKWRDNDLPVLRGVLGPWLERNGLAFYHGGVTDEPPRVTEWDQFCGVRVPKAVKAEWPTAWEQLGLDLSRVQVLGNPLTKIVDYPSLWEPIGLGLVPLADSAFNRAKSWLKGLEASACGIPFVASRLPEYELLGAGRLASTRAEWAAHLEALLDSDVRAAEGAANRARAEELSIGNQWGQWDEALREAVASQPVSPVPAARFAFERRVVRRPVRVAVGITTYNRPGFFSKVAASVAKQLPGVVDRVYVHDDGSSAKHAGEYRRAFGKLPDAVVQADGVNRGVGPSKNALLRAMLEDGAEWLFLLEDDIKILSPRAVTGYIEACETSGLHHLMFAHHGPANDSGPVSVDGPVSFFPHAVGAWSVYSRESLERAGLMDEEFDNALEHVEHSARIAAAGLTSGPYRWADATGSQEWLRELPGSIDASSIGTRPDRIIASLDYWRSTKPETYETLFGPGLPLAGWAEHALSLVAA